MSDWYSSAVAPREQLMSLQHTFDSATMLGYSAAATPFSTLQPHTDLHANPYQHAAAYSHAHNQVQAAHAAAAAYTLQRQQQQHHQFGFSAEQQWRAPDGSIMEMRKEKSRDAARSRRGKENTEFYELAKMLPLPSAITSQLDKASIIRLTISYLKLREFTKSGDPPWSSVQNKNIKGMRGRNQVCSPLEIFDVHQGTHILQALDGFAFTLANDGRFLYISETVSIYLGLSQVELAGSSVFEYIHQDDHQELADQLELTLTSTSSTSGASGGGGSSTSSSVNSLVNSSVGASCSPSSVPSDDGGSSGGQMIGTMNPDGKRKISTPMSLGPSTVYRGYDRAFCIRMKSTLTKRGCHFKTSGYRVVLVLGSLRPQASYGSHLSPRKNIHNIMGMIGIAIALPTPSANELRLESDMFVSRINFDFSIAHCEPKVSDLLQYAPEELLGRSLYSLCHAQDVAILKKTHTDLLQKGQVMSPYYRILNKSGGYSVIQTCATAICNSKNSEEQNIICVNYVISGPHYDSVIFDQHQLDPTLSCVKPDVNKDYTVQHSPEKSGSDTPTSQTVDSPTVNPQAPSHPMTSGSHTPPQLHHRSQEMQEDSRLLDCHTVLHDSRNSSLQDQLDPNSSLHDNGHNVLHDRNSSMLESHSTLHDGHSSMHDPQHDLRHSSSMDHDSPMGRGDPLIPLGGPLTPQLTPVGHIGGNITPIVSTEGESIKTETGSILTPLTVPDSMDDPHRTQKLSPITPQSHLQYNSLALHNQLSPASSNRYSPISNTQLSPNTHYQTMPKLTHPDLEGSVRHLEAAMTRHLPQDSSVVGGLSIVNSGIGCISSDLGSINTAIGSLNGGISSVPGGFSAIQWAGHLSSTKRETVIRTSRDPSELNNPPCSTSCTANSLITPLPSSGSGVLQPTSAYTGYHISPPSSVSPDRLKAMPCDPYTDLYNPAPYTNNVVAPKNAYDNLRWYPA